MTYVAFHPIIQVFMVSDFWVRVLRNQLGNSINSKRVEYHSRTRFGARQPGKGAAGDRLAPMGGISGRRYFGRAPI